MSLKCRSWSPVCTCLTCTLDT
ncbi:unnamed protein product [Leptidea sinapis]|uniref:Uncharacterized protein n=1 Tax=Leptidea sinapis TaxID=189913 RepID=A0A5E4PN95_9NEOP|nr:unnamed protein product [Leptidea sinapis]